MNTYTEDDLNQFKQWVLTQEQACSKCGTKFRFSENVQIELTEYSIQPFDIKTGIISCSKCDSVFFPNVKELIDKFLEKKNN